RRVVRAVVVAVVLVLVAAGARLWWENPSRRSVELPEGIEQGVVAEIGGIGPLCTSVGLVEAGGLRAQGHEWVGTLWRTRVDPGTGASAGEEETFELRLGESFYAEGLGTVTLLAVNPPPLQNPLRPRGVVGGWTYRVNVVLDPGVVPEKAYWQAPATSTWARCVQVES
ncbi:hypothetical protein D4740_12560, partial [Actinomyces sp. 2119]|uniref:hypothetical protein n=1 Tax=Actinomyces sp. 2119 TaxID=2321393 RepID=UPI000FF6137B